MSANSSTTSEMGRGRTTLQMGESTLDITKTGNNMEKELRYCKQRLKA